MLDVVAHEFMHGVTSFSADLRSVPIADGLGPDRIVLENGVFSCEDVTQSLSDGTTVPYFCVDGRFALASNHGGAINEAFSDAFGTGVEFFVQEPGSGPLRADYESGEELPLLGPIRSLASPQSLRIAGPVPYPDHFGRRLRFGTVVVEGTRAAPTRLALYPLIFLDDQGNFLVLGSTDAGGVHMNATILAHAFYLAIEGGENATSGLTVQGVGAANREQIERVFFRATTEIMPSFANLPIAAAVLFQSSLDLFGGNSSVSTAVLQALLAVGF